MHCSLAAACDSTLVHFNVLSLVHACAVCPSPNASGKLKRPQQGVGPCLDLCAVVSPSPYVSPPPLPSPKARQQADNAKAKTYKFRTKAYHGSVQHPLITQSCISVCALPPCFCPYFLPTLHSKLTMH